MNSYDPSLWTVDIDSIINLRDLSGMPIKDGRLFPSHIFLRSGTIAGATPEALEKLKEYGVTTVIDLRSVAEVKKYGNPAIADKDIAFYNVPLFLGDPDAKEDPTMLFLRDHHLGDFYVLVMEGLGSEIVRVLNILAEAEGCALFHCAHGKDRTGIISAMIYLLAGASREDIIRNYEYSYEYISWFLDPLIEKREDEYKHTLRSDRINMEIMLDHIDSKYGGSIKEYLSSNGMTSEQMERLTEKFSLL